MYATVAEEKSRLMVTFAILVAFGTLVLDLPQLQFQELKIWAKLMPPLLLVAGLIGSITNTRIIRAAGWLGILCFFVLATNFVLPGEDYILGIGSHPSAHAPNFPGPSALWRLVVWLILSMSLVWCFWKLGARSKRQNDDVAGGM